MISEELYGIDEVTTIAHILETNREATEARVGTEIMQDCMSKYGFNNK